MSYEKFGASSAAMDVTAVDQTTAPVTVRDGPVLVTRGAGLTGTVLVEVRVRHPSGFWPNGTDGWVPAHTLLDTAPWIAELPCETQVRARCSAFTSGTAPVSVGA
jgi:hypothetical protein